MQPTNFHSPYPWRLHIKFGFDWPSSFRGEDLSKWFATDAGRTPEHGYTISSPCEPDGELKIDHKNLPTLYPMNTSLVMRKPAFCICENKDADQLRGNREADQRLCFRYTDSTIPLLPKSEISSL